MDLSYAVVLLQQAIVLRDQKGTPAQWDSWTEEARAWIRELGEQ